MRNHALHLITTGQQELKELADVLARCNTDWIDAIHIREKHRSARDLMQWHEQLRPLLPRSALFINDRVDAAAAVHAAGVQLGCASVAPDSARRLLAPGTRIGSSVHNAEEALQAARLGADFLLFGHLYSTSSKPDIEPRGCEQLKAIVNLVDVPVLAIGGITPEHVLEVAATGCAGIAVLSGVLLHTHPEEQLSRYHRALESAHTFVPRRKWL